MGCHFLLQGIFLTQALSSHLCIFTLAGGFFTTESPGKARSYGIGSQTFRGHQNYLEGLLKHSCLAGFQPRISDSAGLGYSRIFAFLMDSQDLLMLQAQELHFQTHCTGVMCVKREVLLNSKISLTSNKCYLFYNTTKWTLVLK